MTEPILTVRPVRHTPHVEEWVGVVEALGGGRGRRPPRGHRTGRPARARRRVPAAGIWVNEVQTDLHGFRRAGI